MALPTESDITGIGTTNAQQKVNFAGMRNFIANLLGTTETTAGARTALGAGALGGAIFQAADNAAVRAAGLVVPMATAGLSGTSVDFTGLPSNVRRIMVSVSYMSTTGTSLPMIQLGDSGGVETTGYEGTTSNVEATISGATSASGFLLAGSVIAGSIIHGTAVITAVNANLWTFTFTGGGSNAVYSIVGAGSKTLSGVLDRVRITTVGGANTFDSGAVTIFYE